MFEPEPPADPKRLEDLGFDSIWVGEHIFFNAPMYAALTTLTFLAAQTNHVKLGTSVVILPLRPPAVTAKEAATVDILSRGRLILGVGVGGEHPKEFEACGIPLSERGARTDEAIDIMQRLWVEDHLSFQGRFHQMNDVTLFPKPVQKGGPPIWVA